MIDEKILNLDDGDATLSAVFVTKNFPQFSDDLVECHRIKVEYDALKKDIDKLLASNLDAVGRTHLARVYNSYCNIWFLLEDINPKFSAFLITNRRFHKKRGERLALVHAELDEASKLKSRLLLIKLDSHEEQIASLEIKPINVMKKEKTKRDRLEDYHSKLSRLSDKFKDLDTDLKTSCPFLYRGLEE